jgi:ribosomal protein L37AE/L43A
MRLGQIAVASSIPTRELFRSIGSSLIRKSNAFIIKARKLEASGGRMRIPPGKKVPIQPVAGYFSAAAETMSYEMKKNRVTRWRQKMPNGDYKEWNPRDIIHVHFDKKDGFVFGTPITVPVMDDIRALRKIEENIELLIYQHLFPIFQYIVGTEGSPAGLTETGEKEVDVVRREIQFMPSEGGIVTPFRHEIRAIGAEAKALRADGYLEHFKKRVFAGLGVSAVDMGEGETANRACYSEDTETLTDSGFKYYWEITSEDKIATFNPEIEELEFHYPNGDMLLYEHKGKMIAFKNRNVDVLVTPDHDMWVGQPTFSGNLNWDKIQAENIPQFQFKFKTGNVGWTGIDPEDFQLPNIPYNCYSETPNAGPFPRISIHDWLEFLGYYVSEGCLAKSKGKWAVTIAQNERVNPVKTERIRQCLNRLPFKYNEYIDPKDQTTRFWINCKSLYLYLQENCGDYSYLKRLPHEILEYKQDYLGTLLEALMLGDGTTDKREGRTSRTYYSKSEKLLDQVQEIAIKLGYRAHILPGSRCGRVCISKNTVSNITKDFVKEVDYSGKVYCFNIPNHLFITRRNGRVGIHGNTADNMSRNLIDSVKDYQQVFETFFNTFIINELLLESTFGSSVLDEENRCFLKFKEIDVDAQIKKEAHFTDQFAKDVITHDEARRGMGKEPLRIPSRKEIESETDTAELYPEWHRMQWKLFTEPKLLIQALDEPWTALARAVAKNSILEVSQDDIEKVGEKQNEQEVNLEKERTRAKVAVARKRPAAGKTTTRPSRPKRKDGVLTSTYQQITRDTVNRVAIRGKLEHDWVGSLIRTQMGTTIDKLIGNQMFAFRGGFAEFGFPGDQTFMNKAKLARRAFSTRAERYINKLTKNVISLLKRRVDNDADVGTIVRETRAAFDSLKFRTSFIEDVEIRKARNLGRMIALRDRGVDALAVAGVGEEACATCISNSRVLINTHLADLEDLPPFHAGCNCFMVIPETTVSAQDSEGSLPPPPPGTPLGKDPADKPLPKQMEADDVASCPECGKTAIRKKDTPDIFNCRACKHSFRVIKNQEDAKKATSKQSQFAKCVIRAKARLRVQHPDWDEERLEMLAETACDHILQDKIEDADKLERCVLRVKARLRKENPDWSEDRIKSSAFTICNSSLKGK